MRILAPLLLLAAIAAAQEAPDPQAAETAWQELQKEFRDASDEFYRPYREAKARGEEYQLDYSKHPNRTFAPRYLKFAEEHAGTPAAAFAWAQVVRLGPTEQDRARAIEVLLEAHIDSKALKSVVGMLRYRPRAASSLRTIEQKSPHRDIRGLALLTLGQVTAKSDAKEAATIFRAVKEKYGDVPYYGRYTLGTKADSEIYEAEHLSVGQAAPEIEGEDIDGVAFKLSDYRGKVVMLDFWGDW
jgi:hypothetical protein